MTIPLPPPDYISDYGPEREYWSEKSVRQAQRLALEAAIKSLVNRPRESPTIVLAHMLKEIE